MLSVRKISKNMRFAWFACERAAKATSVFLAEYSNIGHYLVLSSSSLVL